MSDKSKVDEKNKQDFYIEEVELDTHEREKKVSQKTLEIPVIEARQRRMEAEQNLAPRSERPQNQFMEEYGKYVIIGAVALVLIIILVLLGTKMFKPANDPGDTTEATSTEEDATSTEEESSTIVLDTSLALTQDENVKQMMADYYQAMASCDINTIHRLVEDDSQYTLENLQKKSLYIEDYKNIICYTKPGLYEGEYILYVYSEIKFINIDTPAPQLNHYYLNRTEQGTLQMANGVLEGDKVDYMNTEDQKDDVKELIEDVSKRLTSAMESDEKLFELVKLLNNVVVPESTEGSSEDESGETFYVNGELFYRVDETVYVKNEVNVRSQNSVESVALGALYPGDYVRRTGYSENWSQIEYKGQVAYVYKGNLTTQKPE